MASVLRNASIPRWSILTTIGNLVRKNDLSAGTSSHLCRMPWAGKRSTCCFTSHDQDHRRPQRRLAASCSPTIGVIGTTCVGMVAPCSIGMRSHWAGGRRFAFRHPKTRRIGRAGSMWKAAPLEPPFSLRWRLLTGVSATVFATEPSTRLTDEAIASDIPVIVTVAVIVGI